MNVGAIVTLYLDPGSRDLTNPGFVRQIWVPHAVGIGRVSLPEERPLGWAPFTVLARTQVTRPRLLVVPDLSMLAAKERV